MYPGDIECTANPSALRIAYGSHIASILTANAGHKSSCKLLCRYTTHQAEPKAIVSEWNRDLREVSNESPDLWVGIHKMLNGDCCVEGQTGVSHNTQHKWVGSVAGSRW